MPIVWGLLLLLVLRVVVSSWIKLISLVETEVRRKDTPLKVERNNLPWTQGYATGEIITLPIAHGEGQFYADEATLSEIEDRGQVVFRYEGDNPNSSLNNIAGICNSTGNVLGMMPHPERASDPMLGGSDGLRLFQGLLEKVAALV